MSIENKTEEEIVNLLNSYKEDPPSTKNKPNKWFFITTASSICLIALLLLLFTLNLYSPAPQNQTGPAGAILSPTHGSTTGNKVRVQGKTENIEPGQHVWLVVDKPALELCWPKDTGIKPNCSFITTINENGPEEPYVLSLYTVNQTIHNQLADWTDQKLSGGFPMLPQSRKLDSVTLMLDS